MPMVSQDKQSGDSIRHVQWWLDGHASQTASAEHVPSSTTLVDAFSQDLHPLITQLDAAEVENSQRAMVAAHSSSQAAQGLQAECLQGTAPD